MEDEVHLIADPERGPNHYIDAVALARGEMHVYTLRDGMTFDDFLREFDIPVDPPRRKV